MEFLRPSADAIEKCRHIPESVATQEQLCQNHKMEALGRLAAGVAHDFNNLLVGILGYSEILTSKLDPAHPLRPKAEEIKRAALLARELTSKLLAFSHNEMLKPQIVDITIVARDIENLLRRTLGEDVLLVMTIPSTGLFVKIDPARFKQTLLNLAINARDAMHPGGILTIEIKGPELRPSLYTPLSDLRFQPYVTILVEDAGSGIAPEVLPHIFEPFFTTKGIGKGTGLGLAMAYSFVKHSGGLIAVRTQQDLGTTFEINLPLTKKRPMHEGPFTQLSSISVTDGKLLDVEDNEIGRIPTFEI